MENKRKIVFVLRSDNTAKPGGDTVQVAAYEGRLRARGWEVQTVDFHAGIEFDSSDVVHLVNIDRVFDFILCARVARRARLFVTPIHHANHRVRYMRRTGRARGLLAVLNRLPEGVREYLGFLVREVRRSDVPWTLRRLARVVALVPSTLWPWRFSGRLLERAEAVFLLAPGEGRDLQRDSGWRGDRAVLTPNAVDVGDVRSRPWEERGGIVVVGRVEPRKRTLELAQRAEDRGLKVTVIGRISDVDTRYAEDYRDFIRGARHVTHIDGLSHQDTLARIAKARVLVNPSLVEVQSLVELEAATLGAYVVTGPSGNSADWIGPERLSVIPNFDVDPLLTLAHRLCQSVAGPPSMSAADYPWDWDRVVDVLEKAYLEERNAR